MTRPAVAFAYIIEPPFNYRTPDGDITGCDVELAMKVLNDVGVGDIRFVETEFSELLAGLNDGRWRMTTGLFGTDERRKLASFSRPIWALPDGLLVRQGNPLGLGGYRSIADTESVKLAVIRDQLQHRSAVAFGVPAERIRIFATYREAADAVACGRVDAYASVGRAHAGFIDQHRDLALEVVTVPSDEKKPAIGSFAFARDDDDLRRAIDQALDAFLGSRQHRAMMARFGFNDAEVDLVTN